MCKRPQNFAKDETCSYKLFSSLAFSDGVPRRSKSKFSILTVIILPKQSSHNICSPESSNFIFIRGSKHRDPHPRRNWYYCAFRIILFAIWHIRLFVFTIFGGDRCEVSYSRVSEKALRARSLRYDVSQIIGNVRIWK